MALRACALLFVSKFQDMEIIHLHHSHLLLPPYSPHFKFTSHHPPFLKPLNQKWCLTHKPPILCCIAPPNSTNYGGWEDLGLIQDPNNSSKFNQFQDFLVSVGIDDRKHVFMFALGFVSALAISRIRVSSILVFPASVLVFSVGFTLGFVQRGGFLKEISFIDNNKKDDNSKVCVDEKLSQLVEVIGEVGVKVMDLEKEMGGVLMLDRMQNGDLGNCYNIVKSVNSDIVEAKNIVEDTMKDMSGESVNDGQGDKSVNQKPSKKKKDPGSSYFDFFQAVRGLFQESATVTKSSKMKDNAKRESVEQLNCNVTNGQNLKSVSSERTDDVQAISSEFDSETENNQMDSPLTEASENRVSQHVADNSVDGAGKENVIKELVNANPTTIVEDFSHFDYSSRFVNNNRNFMNIGHPNREDMFMPRDKLYDPLDLNFNTTSSGVDVRSFTVDSKTSLQPEEYHMASNRYQGKFHRKRNGENGSSELDIDQWKEESNDTPNSAKQQFAHDREVDSGSSSSVISEDLMFSKNLTEATDLLKNARECLKIRADEDRAEIMLYKAARLLSRAAAMKPMSLLAVGQLGNTFLLHGELKLRISRELRTVLSRNEYSSRGKFRIAVKGLDDRNISRDRVASILIDVCEECEGLLVEAGRQYRMALSIDGNDVRALYNWGLALSYRAQLIADIGPEAASDADRVYLAAIDKFDAMMSKNKVYTPDALFRWGMALQQRSRLRPNNAKEKKKLLHQAKSLFEDALCMDSNKVQVREALSSCISELNYSHF